MTFLVGIISIFLILLYFLDLRKNRLTTKTIIIISMMSGLAFILNIIKLIRYPQGGGISLLYMVPIMLLTILYGRIAGTTGGLILGFLLLLGGSVPIHPIQFLLDYLLGPMALGLSGIFGTNKKYKIILGCFIASMICVFSSFISGIVFFGQYAPNGMNVWLYSFIYNYSSAGIEGILCTFVITLLPIEKFKKQFLQLT